MAFASAFGFGFGIGCIINRMRPNDAEPIHASKCFYEFQWPTAITIIAMKLIEKLMKSSKWIELFALIVVILLMTVNMPHYKENKKKKSNFNVNVNIKIPKVNFTLIKKK